MDQDKFLKIQLQMKQNNEDYKDFLDSMGSWSDEIKHKEKKLIAETVSNSNNSSYPIRNSVIRVKKNKEKKINAYDYKAWDKFDVEKALNDTEVSDGNVLNSEELISQLVKEHREVGNLRFKEGDYIEATAEYTKAILCDGNNAILFTNRAMSLIKMGKYEEAEMDCCKAIELDNMAVKAYYRRAKCRMLLQKNDEALNDLYAVLRLEPLNKIAQKEIHQLEKNLNLRGIVEPIFGAPKKGIESSKPLTKVNIIDVDPNKHLKDVINENSNISAKKNVVDSTSCKEEMPIFTPPLTSIQLSKDLSKFRRNPLHRAKYVSLIDKNFYRKLIGHSLDCELLQDLIDGLSFSLQNNLISPEDFVARVNNLSEVARFSSLWLMISTDEKRALNEVVSSLDPSLRSNLKISL